MKENKGKNEIDQKKKYPENKEVLDRLEKSLNDIKKSEHVCCGNCANCTCRKGSPNS